MRNLIYIYWKEQASSSLCVWKYSLAVIPLSGVRLRMYAQNLYTETSRAIAANPEPCSTNTYADTRIHTYGRMLLTSYIHEAMPRFTSPLRRQRRRRLIAFLVERFCDTFHETPTDYIYTMIDPASSRSSAQERFDQRHPASQAQVSVQVQVQVYPHHSPSSHDFISAQYHHMSMNYTQHKHTFTLAVLYTTCETAESPEKNTII